MDVKKLKIEKVCKMCQKVYTQVPEVFYEYVQDGVVEAYGWKCEGKCGGDLYLPAYKIAPKEAA